MALELQGVATARIEQDFDDTTQHWGTAPWQPPEIPEITARGEIWTIAAVALSLCRRLPDGPCCPFMNGPMYSDPDWPLKSESRRGVRDMGPGRGYSTQLDGILRRCLRWTTSHRPLSYELMVMIRHMESRIFESGVVKLKALPKWVLKR